MKTNTESSENQKNEKTKQAIVKAIQKYEEIRKCQMKEAVKELDDPTSAWGDHSRIRLSRRDS